MTRSLALICCTAVLLLSSAAWAKPKVALTAIDGDASGDVHDAVEEALASGGELALISNKEVTRAVDKVGDVADLSEKDLKKLSTQLSADAIIVGKLEKSGKTKSLKFQIFVHKKLAKGFTVNFKDAKSEKFHKLLHDKILDRLGVEAGSGGGEEEEEKPAKKQPATGEDDEDPLATKGKKGKKGKKAAKAEEEEEAKPKKAAVEEEEAKPKKAAVEEEEEAKPKKAAKPEADDEAPAGDEDGEAKPKKKVASSAEDGGELEGRSDDVPPPARSAATPAIRVDIGASIIARSFNFNATSTMSNPRSKSLSPVPGARLAGEVYPLAISGGKGAASNVGLGFDYDRTLSLKLTSMNTSVKVKQSHWSIGLRYRLAFGGGDNPKTLTLGVGYGKRLFAPDRAATMDAALSLAIARDTPTSEATVLDPGATFRLPFTRAVALSLGVRGLLVTNAGSIQSSTSYGQAQVYGVDGAVGVDIAINKRFALRLAGEVTQVGYSFKGKGKFSNALDGDAATQDVGGLADRSIGGSATFGVLY